MRYTQKDLAEKEAQILRRLHELELADDKTQWHNGKLINAAPMVPRLNSQHYKTRADKFGYYIDCLEWLRFAEKIQNGDV